MTFIDKSAKKLLSELKKAKKIRKRNGLSTPDNLSTATGFLMDFLEKYLTVTLDEVDEMKTLRDGWDYLNMQDDFWKEEFYSRPGAYSVYHHLDPLIRKMFMLEGIPADYLKVEFFGVRGPEPYIFVVYTVYDPELGYIEKSSEFDIKYMDMSFEDLIRAEGNLSLTTIVDSAIAKGYC